MIAERRGGYACPYHDTLGKLPESSQPNPSETTFCVGVDLWVKVITSPDSVETFLFRLDGALESFVRSTLSGV